MPTSATPLGSADQLTNVLKALAETVDQKVHGDPSKSYTAQLFSDGPIRAGKKIAEEAAELALSIAAETKDEAAGEAADLLYHLLVGLRVKGVDLDTVAKVLASRQGLSGLEEKASRG